MSLATSDANLVARGGREWRAQHAKFRDLAEAVGDWAGIPMSLDGFAVQLEERRPHREVFEKILDLRQKDDRDDGETVHVRNRWYSWRSHSWITLYEHAGRVRCAIERRAEGADRITYWLSTLGASQAWSLDAEMEARRKLAAMLKPHLYEMYELTGSFLETSARSGVSYMLRRARPTVALVPSRRSDPDAHMRILAVLCLHPLAYYTGTWAGAMVPTDDVIAHLLMIRGDEPGFWRRANHHHIESPEAAL